jgi:D-3-phosphoglycerate dehydrogenase
VKILLSQEIGQKAEAMLSQKAQVVIASDVSESGMIAAVRDADVLIIRANAKATWRVLKGCPELKGVVRYGIGLDNIDVVAATECNIMVANTPEAATESVAEHTILLILAVYRQLPILDKGVRKGEWETLRGLTFGELKGKTLGVVGMGRIGCRVAEIAHAFEMHVIGHDPYLTDDEIKKRGAQPVSLNELLSSADCITLHVPATRETENLINEETISIMKQGAVLINVSRGIIVNESALIDALKSGHLFGAGLDVFAQEPLFTNSELLSLRNVVLTPHVASLTPEGKERMGIQAAERALTILSGQVPHDLVNPEVLDSPRDKD